MSLPNVYFRVKPATIKGGLLLKCFELGLQFKMVFVVFLLVLKLF